MPALATEIAARPDGFSSTNRGAHHLEAGDGRSRGEGVLEAGPERRPDGAGLKQRSGIRAEVADTVAQLGALPSDLAGERAEKGDEQRLEDARRFLKIADSHQPPVPVPLPTPLAPKPAPPPGPGPTVAVAGVPCNDVSSEAPDVEPRVLAAAVA